MTSPFATPAMEALRRRLAKPDLDTLRVWNGNEGPTLEQLVDAMPPDGGVAGLVESMATRKDTTMEAKSNAPPARIERRLDRGRPKAPHTDHVRDFKLLDGRPITIDRRTISFVVANKDQPEVATVIGMRVWRAAPVPVQSPYEDVRKWWLGVAPAGNRRATP
ncbi:MAG TPA: hypothetical protein VGF29_05020 [Hyphomicrobiaceae bacterium]|jgi:hypothetical protein